MSDDLIERADAISLNCNVWERIAAKCDLWPDLLAALKAERAENEQLREDADRNAAMYRRAAAMYRRLGDD